MLLKECEKGDIANMSLLSLISKYIKYTKETPAMVIKSTSQRKLSLKSPSDSNSHLPTKETQCSNASTAYAIPTMHFHDF